MLQDDGDWMISTTSCVVLYLGCVVAVWSLDLSSFTAEWSHRFTCPVK